MERAALGLEFPECAGAEVVLIVIRDLGEEVEGGEPWLVAGCDHRTDGFAAVSDEEGAHERVDFIEECGCPVL